MALPELLAGVDVGGTKIAACLVTGQGRVVASRRVTTPVAGGGAVVAEAGRLLLELIAAAGARRRNLAAVGVGVPAVVDRARGVVLWAPNIAGWQEEVEVSGPLARALSAPVSLHYDGHAWMVGEWWLGAARGARDAALIAVGTGVGGGLILGGRLHVGRVGVAGALGWWVMDSAEAGAARPVSEGRLESLCSGRAIARGAGTATAEEAFAAARAGDVSARRAVEKAAEVLGKAAANVVSLVDPEVVVLAGGVIAGGADLLLPVVERIVRAEAQPQMAREVRVTAAELGEQAGWLGAARLAGRGVGEEGG